MPFVDTNVLLYTVSTARSETDKRRIARAVLDSAAVVLSVQVLQEFYVQATRPTRADPIQHQQAVALIEAWCRFQVQDTTLGLVRAALDTSARYRIAYWDATIVEAARLAGCRVLLSEDLSDGQDFNGVRVENPFA